jgi:dTDP-4-amino-4,6-dideoxygalactose transaminase
MRIPINDLRRVDIAITAEMYAAVQRVLAGAWYVHGPELEAFEVEFAAYCGVKHAIGVANCTDGLELALRALEIGPGQEVATVANAGMYGTTAILRAGAIPLYVEVDECNLSMSPDALAAAISSKTAAIVVTHLYGRMARIEELLAIADQAGIPVVEDCAHSHGAQQHGRQCGSWGALGCFSFYPTKNLGALGDAGAVVTSDAALARRVRALRQYGWTAKYHSTLSGGKNSRMDEIQAAVLRVKLPHLDAWNIRRREIAAQYSAGLADCNLMLPLASGKPDDVAHLYVIRSRRRDQIRESLCTNGIGTDIHYPVPDHLQLSMRGVPFRQTSLTVTEQSAREILTLPCFPELTAGEVDEVIRAVSISIVR